MLSAIKINREEKKMGAGGKGAKTGVKMCVQMFAEITTECGPGCLANDWSLFN